MEQTDYFTIVKYMCSFGVKSGLPKYYSIEVNDPVRSQRSEWSIVIFCVYTGIIVMYISYHCCTEKISANFELFNFLFLHFLFRTHGGTPDATLRTQKITWLLFNIIDTYLW